MIRKVTILDYDEVYKLWLSCAGMGLNDVDDSREGINRFLNRNPGTCFVCKEDNKIVGVIMAGNDGRRGYIYHTATHPDYRNNGIATSLVDKVIDAMREIGINKLALVVFEKNKKGNKFWEDLGFTTRDDIIYRNKALVKIVRFDT